MTYPEHPDVLTAFLFNYSVVGSRGLRSRTNEMLNLLDIAKSQATEIASLKAKHQAACQEAAEAEKKARIADAEEEGATDVTQDTYKRLNLVSWRNEKIITHIGWL
ncbi:uncharacterized protein MAM_01780 [Metarhizium album ARSEF 1941]|uniref:Uncharacterized protein n=1 Tax=Metarhizium album (strain ARSEF 1941) TaxID=1081103 RepID=A0A0B2WUV6_METAS|nr:uncharacterized protein MAM_01780 [Metarhizium album ARSEF 1941]KHN99856.1 hypothetical protein MAM_01780 [Metarhizium album ARSEF 1941]